MPVILSCRICRQTASRHANMAAVLRRGGWKMWRFGIVILPLLLTGCDLVDNSSWSNSEFPPDTPTAVAPAPIAPTRVVMGRGQSIPLDNPACITVADARARDAADAGYDVPTQQYVHDHVYADCTTWRTRDATR